MTKFIKEFSEEIQRFCSNYFKSEDYISLVGEIQLGFSDGYSENFIINEHIFNSLVIEGKIKTERDGNGRKMINIKQEPKSPSDVQDSTILRNHNFIDTEALVKDEILNLEARTDLVRIPRKSDEENQSFDWLDRKRVIF